MTVSKYHKPVFQQQQQQPQKQQQREKHAAYTSGKRFYFIVKKNSRCIEVHLRERRELVKVEESQQQQQHLPFCRCSSKDDVDGKNEVVKVAAGSTEGHVKKEDSSLL